MDATNLPPAAAWDEAPGARWASTTFAPQVRWVVVGAAAVALVVAAFGDNGPCSITDPSVCGPDVGFSLAFVLYGASVVLLWWRPVFALLCGTAWSLLDVWLDPVASARLAFSAYLVVCLGVAGVVLLARHRQRRLVESLVLAPLVIPAAVPEVAGRPARPHAAGPGDPGGVAAHALGWLRGGVFWAAAALLVLALPVGWWYQHQVGAERQHLDRAVRVESVAGAAADDGQTFTIASGAAWMPRTVKLDPAYPVPQGASWPLLLDPQDPSWVRAVAEPADPTWLLSICGGLLLLAALLLLRGVEVRSVLPRLRTRHHPVLAVQAVRTPGGQVLVLSHTGARVLATYPCRPPDLTEDQWRSLERFAQERAGDASAAADEQAPELAPVDAVLVGDLRERGWAAVVTSEGVIPPSGPLSPERDAPRYRVEDLLEEEEPAVAERPTWLQEVTVGGPVPDLPLEPRTAATWRVLGWLVLLATALAAPLLTWFVVGEWHEMLPLVGAAAAVGGWGARRACEQVRLTRDGLEVVEVWTRTLVPWGVVDEVLAGRTSVGLEWGSGGVQVDLFGDVEPRSVAYRRAEEVAAGLRTLVDTAHHQPTGGVRRRPTPAALVIAAGSAATVLAAVVRLVG